MNPVSVLLGVARPKFLLLAIACWALAVSAAYWQGYHIGVLGAGLSLLGALAAHVAVNALNEYQDFASGLDAVTRRTPFSGGSGTLPASPEGAPLALRLGLWSALVVVAVGAWFCWKAGWIVLLPGIAGLLLVLGYTPWITRRPWLSLIAPGAGFGLAMTGGVHVALAGEITPLGLLISLFCFGLVSNLLLLNQVPDEEADRSVARRNLVVIKGRERALLWLLPMWAVSALSLVAAISLGYAPRECALGFVPLAVAMRLYGRVFQSMDQLEKIVAELGQNVKITVVAPLTLVAGFAFDRLL